MIVFSKELACRLMPQDRRAAPRDVPQPVAATALAAVGGGLNPQPLPPIIEPEMRAF